MRTCRLTAVALIAAFVLSIIHGCTHRPPVAASPESPAGTTTSETQSPVPPKGADSAGLGTSPSGSAPVGKTLKKTQQEKTLKELAMAVELAPSHAPAYNELGFAYAKAGDYDKAIANYNKALELDRCYDWAFYNRGCAWYDQGKFDLAIADYGRALECNPRYAVAYNNRGNSWYQKGDYEQALKDYAKAVELDPRYAVARSNTGNAYYQKGLYSQALAEFTKAIELDPGLQSSFSNRGVTYIMLQRYEEAEKDLMKAHQMNPDDSVTMVRLAELYSMKDDVMEACKWLKWGVGKGYRDFKYIKRTITLDATRKWPCYESALSGK